MKKNKKIFAVMIAAVVTTVSIPVVHPTAASASTASVSKKAYSLSKKAGTYHEKIRLKLTAKNGFRIYYTKNGNFNTKKVLKSGQSKTFTISKTTTLLLYRSKTVKTAKQLKSAQVQKNAVKYVYKITDAPDTNTGQQTSEDAKGRETAQAAAVSMAAAADDMGRSIENAKPAMLSPAENTSAAPKITCTDSHAEVSNTDDSGAIEINTADDLCSITIKKAGTYILTGGTPDHPAKNITVSIDCDTEDAVSLVLDNLHIDNSSLGDSLTHEQPVICFANGTKQAALTLIGSSSLTGNGSFTKEPASAIIYAKDSDAVLTLLAKDASASLTITDAMDPATDFGACDPADGISSKGTLILQSGIYHISTNGDCLKGSGKDGSGGIVLSGGTCQLTSSLGYGMKSKNGSITVYSGTVNISHTAKDAVQAKNANVNITGGTITIDQCFGDGIQGETVFITGEETKLDITTVFDNAGRNYYDTALGSGNYNTITKTNSTKTEVVNADPGSHKGIKAGTKACTYSYRSTSTDSGLEAGKTYSQEASGGIFITGGQMKVNTLNTGIKYNGSSRMNQNSGSGSIAPADNDGQYIIGAAEDAVHSNHTFLMTGGTLEIASADDGITAADSLAILNNSVIDITDSYEGLEGGNIIIGSTDNTSPQITIYSNDDGVNAASKASVHYDYADESEEVYTKTQTSASDNTFYMLDGYLNVMIADDQTHSFSLSAADGSKTEGTFTADGDGIDCNGSFYAYGGTVIVYGTVSNNNSPIDTDAEYYIGEGVTLLAAGSGAMAENPTKTSQAAIICGGGMTPPGGIPGNNGGTTPPNGTPDNNGGMTPPNGTPDNNGGTTPPDGIPDNNGGNSDDHMTAPDNDSDNNGGMTPPDGIPGNNGGMTPPDDAPGSGGTRPGNMPADNAGTNAVSVSAGTSIAILDSSGNVITAFKAPKALGYLFYTSPELSAGSSYTISSGGNLGGSPVNAGSRYDYRYTDYLTDNASVLMEAEAKL